MTTAVRFPGPLQRRKGRPGQKNRPYRVSGLNLTVPLATRHCDHCNHWMADYPELWASEGLCIFCKQDGIR